MRNIIYIDNFLTGHGNTPTTGPGLVRQFANMGYVVYTASSKSNKLLRLIDMVSTIIHHRKNAVVLIATYSGAAFYFAIICAFVCRLFQVPYIPCLHGGNLPTRIKRHPGLSQLYFGNSFTNVAVSGYLGNCMIVNGWKCNEIPNNIPVDRYKFRCRKNVQPKLFWVRSFHNNYNPQLAIRILKEIKKTYADATLTMVGPDKDDNTLAECKKLIRELQLEDAVSLPGLLSIAEWTSLSDAHDIFINTTNFDNLPVSVIEAMALGMVVITTNVGGIPYLVENGKTAILVSPDNIDSFVKAITEVLANPALAEQLSINANNKAQHFDWSRILILWQQLFASLPQSK